MLEDIKQNYERAKKLAREIWLEGDNEGNANDYYYFECGFVAGLNYGDSEKYKSKKKRLESQYKRETKLQQQIKELDTLVKDQQTIINYAAGYISACEQFRDKHPNDVVKWLFQGLK